MNIDRLTFWNPANSPMGIAATVDSVFEDTPVKINFYWTGMDLATTPRTRAQLEEAVVTCVREHPLVNLNDRTVFHLQWNFDDFSEIQDPGWRPPRE